MEKPWAELGKKIRIQRKKLGFKTQEALASAVGTDRTRVSRWESGEESPRTFRDKLAEVLQVDLEFFKEPEPLKPEPTAAAMIQVIAAQQAEIEALKLTDDERKLLAAYRKAPSLYRLLGIAMLTHDPDDVAAAKAEAWRLAETADDDAEDQLMGALQGVLKRQG